MTPMDLFMGGIYAIIFWIVFCVVCFIFAIISSEEDWAMLGILVPLWLGPFSVAVLWGGALILAIIEAV